MRSKLANIRLPILLLVPIACGLFALLVVNNSTGPMVRFISGGAIGVGLALLLLDPGPDAWVKLARAWAIFGFITIGMVMTMIFSNRADGVSLVLSILIPGAIAWFSAQD